MNKILFSSHHCTNGSYTDCWSIILRFCRLEDRKQCSYVNKFINLKYKLIIPNLNDLMAEIGFLYSRLKFKEPVDNKEIQIKTNDTLLKSYLSYYINWEDQFHFKIGIDESCKNDFEEDIVSLNIEDEYTGDELMFATAKGDWIPIFVRMYEEETFYYVLNINTKSKHYNKVGLFYYNSDESGIICTFESFLNNFPVLLATRSRKLIRQDWAENWQEAIQRYEQEH